MLNHHHKQMVNHLRLNSRKSIKNISIDMKISGQKARRIKRLVDNSGKVVPKEIIVAPIIV